MPNSLLLLQVPVLVNQKLLPKPMPESENITWYLCERYSNLLPDQHAETIKRLVKKLHNISFYSLTFGNMPARGLKVQDKINQTLEDPSISEDYRKALLYKKAQ